MEDPKIYIEAFLNQQKIVISDKQRPSFDLFLKDESIIKAVVTIKESQKLIMSKFDINNKVFEISNKQITFPNATESIPYSARLDSVKNGLEDIVYLEMEGLDAFGLVFNSETYTIEGTPIIDGDVKFIMKYRLKNEAEDSKLNEKLLSFYINKDPKKLWGNIESDKTDPFWKEDNVSVSDKLGPEKNIVVSSKRGRSHANVGSFRDDDFSFKYNEATGWSAIAVADGAGSYKYSRQGSKIACDEIVQFIQTGFTQENSDEIEALLRKLVDLKKNSFDNIEYNDEIVNGTAENTIIEVAIESEITDESIAEKNKIEEVETIESITNKIKGFLYKNLGTTAFNIHKKIEAFATEKGHTIKDYGSTLIFALFKKMDIGYCILTFGVGDCPMAVINKDESKATLLNWLDVGEFGGGTRFITMPEIFSNPNFITRLNFEIIEDFSYLILMSDGIYDPKFIVEANLEKTEKWKEFIADLKGNNEDQSTVVFDKENKDIADQLSTWMDFWSAGNHDDRTLAIVY